MVGYSASSKVYRVYNESTGIVEETYDVELDETNDRYEGVYGDEDEEEQRRAMKKMPKGEIKPKDDEEEIVEQIGPSSTLEEDDDKPPTNSRCSRPRTFLSSSRSSPRTRVSHKNYHSRTGSISSSHTSSKHLKDPHNVTSKH